MIDIKYMLERSFKEHLFTKPVFVSRIVGNIFCMLIYSYFFLVGILQLYSLIWTQCKLEWGNYWWENSLMIYVWSWLTSFSKKLCLVSFCKPVRNYTYLGTHRIKMSRWIPIFIEQFYNIAVLCLDFNSYLHLNAFWKINFSQSWRFVILQIMNVKFSFFHENKTDTIYHNDGNINWNLIYKCTKNCLLFSEERD